MLAELFGPDLLILVLGLVIFAIPLWAVIDAAVRPQTAWQAAGQSKVLWLILVIATWLLTGILGLVLAIVYLTVIRPKVAAAG